MRVGILTYHFADNYGAVLQTKATRNFLKTQGHDANVINYASERMLRGYTLNPFRKPKKQIIRSVVSALKRKRQYELFDVFRKEALNTQNNKSRQDISELEMNYDAVISGSDQVWNLDISMNDTTYFLDFVSDDIRKIGYAISMGKKRFSPEHEEIVLKYAPRFNALSFRENDASKYYENLTGKEAATVVDPVFLLSDSEWCAISKKPTSIKENENFILLYQLEKNEELIKRAKELSEKENIPVKAIHPLCVGFENGITLLNDVGPAEFLWLIKNAKYVCTNSFHGMAFSIIFNKKLCCALHKTLGVRNAQLLQLLGVTDTSSVIDIATIDKTELNNRIDFSKKWLLSNLEN